MDMLKDRKKASLEAWFDERGVEWCAAVEVYCADMGDAYHEAAQAKLPHARQTVDRFHGSAKIPGPDIGTPSRRDGRYRVQRYSCTIHPITETPPVNSGD